MSQTIKLGSLEISFTSKKVQHVQLSVHPPDGRVSLVAPLGTRDDAARAFAISKLGWIRDQQDKLRSQARETPRRFVERESHYLWGKRFLLTVKEEDKKPSISLGHRTITLIVRPGSDSSKRAAVIHEWHKSLLHRAIPNLIATWEPRLDVKVNRYFLQRMKTKWGSCNHYTGTIRLNTELVKKPRHLLEYVVVHELLHLVEPRHNERFAHLLSEYYPTWQADKVELNELPLTATTWNDSTSDSNSVSV